MFPDLIYTPLFTYKHTHMSWLCQVLIWLISMFPLEKHFLGESQTFWCLDTEQHISIRSFWLKPSPCLVILLHLRRAFWASDWHTFHKTIQSYNISHRELLVCVVVCVTHAHIVWMVSPDRNSWPATPQHPEKLESSFYDGWLYVEAMCVCVFACVWELT